MSAWDRAQHARMVAGGSASAEYIAQDLARIEREEADERDASAVLAEADAALGAPCLRSYWHDGGWCVTDCLDDRRPRLVTHPHWTTWIAAKGRDPHRVGVHFQQALKKRRHALLIKQESRDASPIRTAEAVVEAARGWDATVPAFDRLSLACEAHVAAMRAAREGAKG